MWVTNSCANPRWKSLLHFEAEKIQARQGKKLPEEPRGSLEKSNFITRRGREHETLLFEGDGESHK